MAYWIYKCNSRNGEHQRHYGDWQDFFRNARANTAKEWGTSEIVPALAKLEPNDVVIAYQTDRNELVGVTKVAELVPRDEFFDVMLTPVERIGVKVRPLKLADQRIAEIPALKAGPIMTLYRISHNEAQLLLRAARSAASEQDTDGRRSIPKAKRR